MKKTNITMLCLAAACACGDTKITWLADVTADRAETVTGVQSGQVAAAAAHILRTDNPHGVTAAQIGALTNETDAIALAALAAHAAYWPPNATASSWFTFTTNNGAITITGYNIAGGTDVVIPDYINGWPVTEIGAQAFDESGVTSIGGAGNVVTVGNFAFGFCGWLRSVSLPQAQTVGDGAFTGCSGLTSVPLPQAQTVGNFAFSGCVGLTSVPLPQVQTVGNYAFSDCGGLTSLYFDNDAPAIGAEIFEGLNPNQVTNYVTNPQATGWGATLDGMPVVRPTLYADAFTLNGDTITEWPAGGATNITDGVTSGTYSEATRTIDISNLLAGVSVELPDGIVTNEQDLAALRAYHYGSPDIVESPAEWFVFDGAGTITAFNWSAGRENVVIPWEIGGVPVTTIGVKAFFDLGVYIGFPVTSVIAPQTVKTIGDYAFYYCDTLTSVTIPQATAIGDSAFYYCISLTSVTIPQVTAIGDYAFYYCDTLTSVTIPQATAIGDYAFYYCTSLASVSLPQATAIGDYAFGTCTSLTAVRMGQNAPAEATGVFSSITPPPTVYVTNPQATGWGDTWNGAPVVRPPLYADAIYQAGELVATEAHVAEQIADIEFPVASTNYTAWTGTITPANGTATVSIAHGNMPVLVTTAPCVLTLDPTGYGTAGVSRVSLSYYPGTNSFTFATNVITYSATPNVDTNGWNTLLIRRVSDGAWKGVGL